MGEFRFPKNTCLNNRVLYNNEEKGNSSTEQILRKYFLKIFLIQASFDDISIDKRKVIATNI